MKKFFTLLAAVAFCGFSVANAQTPADIAPGIAHTDSLKQGALYHIAEGADYIYVGAKNALMWGQTDALAAGLWCVKAQTPASSTYPEFTFESKSGGDMLGVDLTTYFNDRTKKQFEAVLTFSDVNTWRFSSKYQNNMDKDPNYLMSYPTVNEMLKDSVAVLSQDAGKVYVNLIPAPAAST